MQAKEVVEERVVVRGEIRAVPPEPVAALGGVDFAQRGGAHVGRELAAVDFPLQKGARFAEQIPRAVFLLLADPDVEVAADPRAGVQGGELVPRRMLPEILLDGAARQPPRLGLDAAVERAEKALAAVGESLPRVLAVEDERDEAGLRRDHVRDVPEMREEVLGGGDRRVFRGHEADEIRERLFAKHRVHRRAVVGHAPALEQLQMIHLAIAEDRVEAERIEEVFLVAAKILDAAPLHQRDQLRCDRALARPQSARRFAKEPGVLLDREREVRGGILRPVEALRKLPSRQAAHGQGRVIDERQDRVEKRRGRQLGLPALLGRAIFLRDEPHDFQMDVEHAVLLGLGEMAAFELERGQLGKEPFRGVAAPREIEPHLEIEEFLRGKIPQPALHFVAVKGEPPLVQQLPVAREGLHEIVPVDFEEVLEDRELLVLLQIRRGLARPVEPEGADFSPGQRLDLEQQHRREIEIHAHAGEVLDDGDHVEIALHAVQPDPRHHRGLRPRIDVVRLVHVPKKNDVCHAPLRMGKRARGQCRRARRAENQPRPRRAAQPGTAACRREVNQNATANITTSVMPSAAPKGQSRACMN